MTFVKKSWTQIFWWPPPPFGSYKSQQQISHQMRLDRRCPLFNLSPPTPPPPKNKLNVIIPETHIKRQATRHDCLPGFVGDGDKLSEIVHDQSLWNTKEGPEKRDTEKGGLGGLAHPPSWSAHRFLLEKEALGTSLYAVFTGTQIIIPIYKELFNKIFEAFNLFKKICSRNSATWQWPPASLH
jgi:hypothetical protein